MEDEGAEAQFVSRLAAVENLFLAQPVSLRFHIASDAAVEAVVAAVVRNLDKTAEEDVATIDAVADFGSLDEEAVNGSRVGGGEETVDIKGERIHRWSLVRCRDRWAEF